VKGRFGLGMGFWVGEGISWLRVKTFGAWDEVWGWLGVNLAQS
jgi:hypothetical protein